ncbi:MAG TPA: RNA polymerase sigma-70 factor [Porphyromonadaceae bacterium]|nr:RNA polymerase sigma-70 factor [Porphyromonadaceae bacterium]
MIILKEEIIKKINQGDPGAFRQLYSAYYTYLCAVATKYIHQAEDAQEIVNDVFLNIWKNKVELTAPVGPYLIRAVKNRCINYITRQKMTEVSLTDVQEQLLTIQEEEVGKDENPLAYLENKELEELIEKAVKTLPPKCRTIFEQHLYQNMSYEEIAKENKIAASTVRVQIKIGLERIKTILGDHYPLFLLLLHLPVNLR